MEIFLSISFFIVLAIYFIVAARVHSWQIMCNLGFHSSCPLLFLKYPDAYVFAGIFLGSISFVLFLFTPIPGIIGITLLISAYIYSGKIGQKWACNNYRDTFRELVSWEDTPEKDKIIFLEKTLETNENIINMANKKDS